MSQPPPFPRVTDWIGRTMPPMPPASLENARLVVERMLWEPGSRLTSSKWVSAYCRAVGRPQDVIPYPTREAIQNAGRLLARAVELGWVLEAPGPRGGRGWAITTAGLQPLPDIRRQSA